MLFPHDRSAAHRRHTIEAAPSGWCQVWPLAFAVMDGGIFARNAACLFTPGLDFGRPVEVGADGDGLL